MNKSLVMFLVATLLLAGCTELLDSEDGETKNIEVNEDIALEKIGDFMTVDESESFGITMMYEMDPAMMGMEEGMLEVGEDSEAVITIEMTEAWSPDGYHTTSSTGMVNGGSSMKFVTSMTHIGTTMYIEMGYETQGDLCADEESEEDIAMCEMMFGDMPAVQSYSMTTSTTHTEAIAAMAEETGDDADMDPRFMLEFISYTECMGSFTPAGTVDGLQMFNVSMDMMGEDSSLTPQLALCMFDSDDSNTISYDELLAADESDADDEEADELKTTFDESDLDTNGELNNDELATFIEAMEANEEEHDHDDHSDHSDDHGDHDEMDGGEDPEMMPDMSVAFNNAGEIEYFSMYMEGTEMKMYVLTEDRVDSFFANVDAGTIVALPFSISDSIDDDGDDGMDNGDRFYCDNGNEISADFVNNGYDDCGDNSDENSGGSGDYIDAFLTDNWAMGEEAYTSPEFYIYSGFDQIDSVEFSLADSDGTILTTWSVYPSDFLPSDGDDMMYFVNLDGVSVDEECYTLYAVWLTTDMDSGMTQRDDICFDRTEAGDDSYIDEMIEAWMSAMDADGDGIITWEEHDAFISSDEGWESDEERNDSMMTWSQFDSDSNGGLDDVELADLLSAMPEDDDDGDGGEDALTPQELLDVTDTDSSGTMTKDEFNAYLEGMPQEMIDDYNMIFDEVDTDDSGDLDIYELEQLIIDIDDYMMAYEESQEMFICDNGNEITADFFDDGDNDCGDWSDEPNHEGDEEMFTCDNGETVPMSYVDDGYEDCADGSDESNTHDDNDDHDHGSEDDEPCYFNDENELVCGERVWYITNEMDFHFEGDMSTYYIEFATCEEETDYETGETTKDCSTYSQILVADAAAAGGSNGVMYHDADNSGTISEGDMIHVTDEMKMQYDVRLYLMSADAYSDENPMHNAPGFTGLVGMLALLGAAFIRRND